MGSPYDFKIDTLEFRCAIKDDTPYARSTAPFRTQQIDTAATPGDQSLTGWWARAQFSFHRGAGIKYYDVEESSTILNSFQDSSNADPWKPGEVRLIAGPDYPGSGPGVPANIPSGIMDIDYSPFSDATYSVANHEVYKQATQITMSQAGQSHCIVAVGLLGDMYVGCGNRIEKVSAGGTTSTVLWTNNNAGDATGSDRIVGLWYAKERLWAVAVSGDWFALSLAGGTIPAGGGAYLAWASGISGSTGIPNGDWSFAGTPGAVYVAHGQYVYSVSTGTSGDAVATTAVDTVVDLGRGRTIMSIGYCRGFLGIVEQDFFLIGAIAGDGSVALGPTLVSFDGSSTCRSVAAAGDKMYFTAYLSPSDTNFALYEVDLASDTSNLQPAWQTRIQNVMRGGSGTSSFCVSGVRSDTRLLLASSGSETANRYTYAFDGGTATVSSGWLLTGYHRLGTMDDKTFHEVQVTAKVANDAGQYINVYRVDSDGTETLIGQAGDGKTPLLLGDVKAESIALKFELMRGTSLSGYSPTLLGYQLKALPVPKRQRLLKWPLQLTDTWRDKYGQGHGRQGRAWEDLQALEALESNKAIVPFTDNRTGETGNAYIDSVEFQSDTPSTPTSNGFGGIAYVQLRVIGS